MFVLLVGSIVDKNAFVEGGEAVVVETAAAVLSESM